MSILELKQVTYKYPNTSKKVIKSVDASFERGRLYSIMGKSGAGKSTILALVSGLDLCSNGQVLYNGIDLSKLNRDDYRARKIGVIFQGYNLLLNATALENVELSMSISGSKEKTKRKTAYAFLKKMGIDKETADRKVLKLSGGEQQRVGIARAISHNPDIIIADEPTGNLDKETEESIMKILSSLAHDENKCIIVVTHSKKVASYADELWGLNGGRMLAVK